MVVREAYQEDSDFEEGVEIPEDDPDLVHLKAVYTQISLSIGDQFEILLVKGRNRELSGCQQDFMQEILINCGKNYHFVL